MARTGRRISRPAPQDHRRGAAFNCLPVSTRWAMVLSGGITLAVFLVILWRLCFQDSRPKLKEPATDQEESDHQKHIPNAYEDGNKVRVRVGCGADVTSQ